MVWSPSKRCTLTPFLCGTVGCNIAVVSDICQAWRCSCSSGKAGIVAGYFTVRSFAKERASPGVVGAAILKRPQSVSVPLQFGMHLQPPWIGLASNQLDVCSMVHTDYLSYAASCVREATCCELTTRLAQRLQSCGVAEVEIRYKIRSPEWMLALLLHPSSLFVTPLRGETCFPILSTKSP